MPGINEIRERIKGAVGNAAGITRGFAERAASGAKYAARTAKLAIDINNEKESIKRSFTEIGKLFYETRGSSGSDEIRDLCDRIDAAKLNIERLEEEKAELKADYKNAKEADFEVEFEEVAAKEEFAAGSGESPAGESDESRE